MLVDKLPIENVDTLKGFNKIKTQILEFHKHELETRCNFVEELQAIEDEFRNPNGMGRGTELLQELVAQLQKECFCNAFLVPCVECDPETGVLLACLTVQNGKILKICNNVRQQIISGPMLHYFLTPPDNVDLNNVNFKKLLSPMYAFVFTQFLNTFCCGEGSNTDFRRSFINFSEVNNDPG